jgi:di/tricarboxylate transporter
MNNLTNALEFMQETRFSLIPKTVFLIGSFLLFYLCLFGLMYYAKRRMRFHLRDAVPLVAAGLLFAVLMWLLRDEPRLNIALSVIFVYAMFARIYIHSRKVRKNI